MLKVDDALKDAHSQLLEKDKVCDSNESHHVTNQM